MIAALLFAVQDPGVERPSARAAHLSVPPRIDGRLDEPCWREAPQIGELTQVEPHEGAPPSERTEVRILFDEHALYIGVRCFDRDPSGIIATQMARDAELDYDDRLEIVIDSFRDRRNAYFFQVNPAGDKGDALVSNNGQDFNKPWDGIWEGAATIDAEGWSAELAIPFQTLAFDPADGTWGFNINRWIKRRNEVDRWSSPRNDTSVFLISKAGDLAGLYGLHQGLGLDVVPFFHGDWTRDRESGEDDLVGKPGLDAFYRVTPSLQAVLTINTDFAETEVDTRQLNLTRFPLFFPEKRSFFLQDAGIFQFADLGHDLIPFFSRRVGLDDSGQEVPILYGAKLTGRQEGWNIGTLYVRTDAHESEVAGVPVLVPERDLAVARISRNLGEASTLGGIFTSGDPNSATSNQLYGLDWNYRTSGFQGDKNLTSSLWLLQTRTPGKLGDDLAYGASIGAPNDLWTWKLAAREVQPNFDPALGFVPRTGVRTYDATLQYDPRLDGAVRQMHYAATGQVVTGLDERLQSALLTLQPLGFEWDSGDELRFQLIPQRENLDADFEISDNVTLPPGDYTWTRARVEFESALKRPVSCNLALEGGSFYDGHREDAEAELSWRPSRFFNGALAYTQNHVVLDEGTFTDHLGSVHANWTPSPEVEWRNFLQFDNVSESLGINSRVRWILQPGSDLFLVWNQTQARVGDSFVPLFQEAAFKIGYTLRF
jgi:hypothetical protein